MRIVVTIVSVLLITPVASVRGQEAEPPTAPAAERSNVSPMLRTTPALKRCWREEPNLSVDFLNDARAARDSIPPQLWEKFAARGWTVHLTDLVVNAAPFLRGRQPRGWPADMTWENADAVHLPQHRMVVIASHRLNRDGRRVAARRVGGVLRHELGHALDIAFNAGVGRLSDSVAFRDSYAKDLAVLEASDSLAYYVRNGRSGATETFAELLADWYGGGSDVGRQAELRTAFAHSRRFLARTLPAPRAVVATTRTGLARP